MKPVCDICGSQIPPGQQPSALWRLRGGTLEVQCDDCTDLFDDMLEETDE